jgi:uracil-DNA glycosylase
MAEFEPENVKIEDSWKEQLNDEFQKEYFQDIRSFLRTEIRDGKTVYPPGPLIFNAFNTTPFKDVKVVIIGQDPYHQPGQAMGLSFSVPPDVKVPPSLKNIFKELHNDLNTDIPTHGDLSYWAEQGVFLLNAILTVERSNAASHRKIGWQRFTNAVIEKLSDERKGLIFLLWGNFARSKKKIIDETEHYVFEAPHPSPLARGGFFGCRHFSKANEILLKQGREPIDWELPPKEEL